MNQIWKETEVRVHLMGTEFGHYCDIIWYHLTLHELYVAFAVRYLNMNTRILCFVFYTLLLLCSKIPH